MPSGRDDFMRIVEALAEEVFMLAEPQALFNTALTKAFATGRKLWSASLCERQSTCEQWISPTLASAAPAELNT
jgi:hypothetical protein